MVDPEYLRLLSRVDGTAAQLAILQAIADKKPFAVFLKEQAPKGERKQIQPIETLYKGYKFRSRLEARWAVFLDAFGMPYAYESEGFDLGKLGWYLPDFYLPQTATWIEVKPVEPTADARLKAKMLTLAREQYVDIVVGTPEFTTGDWFGTGQVLHCYPGSVPPGKQDWCPLRLVAFHWSSETHIDGPWGEAAIAYAVEQARTARFEHGEVPHVYNAWKRARYEHHGAIWTEKADEDSPTNTPIVDAWVLPDEANL